MLTRERPLSALPLQAVARALQRAVNGCHAVAEKLRHFTRRPAESVAEDEHSALFRREQLECSDEREPDALSCLDRDVRTWAGRGHLLQQVVRIGLDVSVDARSDVSRALLEHPKANVRRDCGEA